MTSTPPFDAFLSHSSADKPTVRDLAERLTKDGIRVWFDERELKYGDPISVKIDEGLDSSRRILFFISQRAVASDWVRTEIESILFDDPLNICTGNCLAATTTGYYNTGQTGVCTHPDNSTRSVVAITHARLASRLPRLISAARPPCNPMMTRRPPVASVSILRSR